MPTMTEKDAKRGRKWVKKMRKKGYRVEFVGDETNKDLLKGSFKWTSKWIKMPKADSYIIYGVVDPAKDKK